jgi:hypothetical protein
MTAAFASPQRRENRSEQLKQLRQKIAAMSGKDTAPAEDLVPAGPALLPRGTVAVLSGARSLVLRMVATVTADGGNAVIVGQPDIGLLAAVEMGADLSRIAVVPDPGNDPVEVAAVLIDGMDLVVLGLGGRRVTRTRGRGGGGPPPQKGLPGRVRWWPAPVKRVARCWSPTGTGKGRRRDCRPGSVAMS